MDTADAVVNPNLDEEGIQSNLNENPDINNKFVGDKESTSQVITEKKTKNDPNHGNLNGVTNGVVDEILEGNPEIAISLSETSLGHVKMFSNNSDTPLIDYIVENVEPKSNSCFDGDFSLMMTESESDGEDDVAVGSKSLFKKATKLYDSDTDEGNSTHNRNDATNLSDKEVVDNSSILGQKPKIFALIDSDSESDSPSKVKVHRKKKKSAQNRKKQSKSLQVNSDSSSGENTGSCDSEEVGNVPDTPVERPPQRLSAKEAEEQMKIIQSESQRQAREALISVPYHKPKQHTLKEFLNRRTINRPSEVQNDRRTTAASIRMSPRELEAYAKSIEEREKEAVEFFKSESESDDEQFNPNELRNESASEDKDMSSTVEKDPSCEISKEINLEEQNPPQITAATEEDPIFKIDLLKASSEIEASDMIVNHDIPCSSNSIRPTVINKTKTLRDQVLENVSVYSPSLSGEPDSFIDLDSGDFIPKSKTGAEELMERFAKHTAKKSQASSDSHVNVLSTVDGKLEVSYLKISDPTDENNVVEKRPGEAISNLKKELLASIISRKNVERLKRKQEEEKERKENEEEMDDDDDMESEEEDFDEDEEYEINDIKKELKNPKKKIVITENEEVLEIENNDDEEDEDEVEHNDENDKSSESQESDDDETETGDVKKNRVIRAFEDSDEDVPTCDTEATQITSINYKNPTLDEGASNNYKDGLYPEENEIAIDESQLMDICSGDFTTQVSTVQSNEKGPSEIYSVSNAKVMLESSDEECNNEEAEITNKRTKKLKKKKLRVVDSDGDDDSDNDVDNSEIENEDESVKRVEEPDEVETYIDYDSEENEIEVRLDKATKKKKANEFLENEAELSESEWGSADEDEKDMNRYDIELGDEEQFDKVELQEELGKIHMRRVLDQDIREVKQLQDIFLEDEENDGVGRERQFKWKHLENGFTLDDIDGQNPDQPDGHDDCNDENEAELRKMRYEITQMKNESENESMLVNCSNTLNNTSMKKVTIIRSNLTTPKSQYLKSSPFLIAEPKDVNNVSRGSFLKRDSTVLDKIATLTKSSGDQESGSSGVLTVNTGKAKHFVFSAVERPDNAIKRKSESVIEGDGTVIKKPKPNAGNMPRLIDLL